MLSVARKTLADLERSAKNVRLDDLLAVLQDNGFIVREGTKHGYVAQRGSRTMTVPRHRAVVLPVYVTRAVKLIRRDEEEAGSGDDEEG